MPDSGVSGESGSASTDSPSENRWASSCAEYGKAYCEPILACATSMLLGSFTSLDECQGFLGGDDCEKRMTSSGSTVTPEGLRACAAALSAQTCGQRSQSLPAECSWSGSLPNDSRCQYDSQCQSRRCHKSSAGFCGTCTPLAGTGETCDPVQRSCDINLACAQNSGEWKCAKLLAEGDSCNSIYQCGWGLACMTGRCSPAKKTGESCLANRDCAPDHDLTCLAGASGGTQVCTTVSRVTVGEACATDQGILCSGHAVCKGTDGNVAISGVCCAPVENGQPCNGSTPCQYGAQCLTGKCTTAASVSCN